MKQFWFRSLTLSFFGIAVGLFAEVVLEEWFGGETSLSELTLPVAALLLAVSAVGTAVYFSALATANLNRASDRSRSAGIGVWDASDEALSTRYRGTNFRRLTEIARAAQKQILIFAASGPGEYATADHALRREFLAAVLDTARARRGTGFKYTRIQQLPEALVAVDDFAKLEAHIGEAAAAHCRDACALRGEVMDGLQVEVMKLEDMGATGFMIVDEHIFAIPFHAHSRDNIVYHASVFVIEDAERELVAKYIRYFDSLHGMAKNLNFETAPAPSAGGRPKRTWARRPGWLFGTRNV